MISRESCHSPMLVLRKYLCLLRLSDVEAAALHGECHWRKCMLSVAHYRRYTASTFHTVKPVANRANPRESGADAKLSARKLCIHIK